MNTDTHHIPDSEELALYERQLNFVESVVEFHPTSLGMFNPEELADFKAYFLPDWSKVDDYRSYYQDMAATDPDLQKRALGLFYRYLEQHQVQGNDLKSTIS